MSSDNFISRLVDETYNYLGSEELPAEFSRFEQGQSIKRYPANDNHLFRFLNTQHCEFTHIEHNQQTACFRLKVAGQTLDVPSNWSFFSNLYRFSVSKESTFYEIEDAEFREVLQTLHPEQGNCAFFVVSGRAYYIACGQNYSFVKAWLLKYLEGETQSQSEAA